jgi:hypothetical protein
MSICAIPKLPSSFIPLLEHDPEKWKPVFRKDHAPTKDPDDDPIQFDRIMVWAAAFAQPHIAMQG